MNDTNERSVASDGSVAFGVVNANGEVESIHWKWQDAVGMALIAGKVVPLYRQPQPTLTDAEREAVEAAADLIDNKTCGDSSTLRGLLERLGGGR